MIAAIAAGPAMAGLAGCANPFGSQNGNSGMASDYNDEAKSIAKESRETVQAARDYAQDGNANESRAAIESHLANVNAQIQALQARIDKAGDQATPELRTALRDLQQKSAALQDMLIKAKAADNQVWSTRIRKQIEQADSELQKAYEQVNTQYEETLKAIRNESLQDLETAAKPAFEAARNYLQNHQADQAGTVADKFNELRARVRTAGDRLDRSGAAVKPELRSAMINFQEKADSFTKRVSETRGASDQNWDQVRGDLQRTLDETEKAYNDIKNKMS
jgi:hypothetical protein